MKYIKRQVLFGGDKMYKCYLNGKFYGGGNLQYMRELLVDYVITHKMYGKSEVDFKIVKEEKKK
jgi:hypothetical protein